MNGDVGLFKVGDIVVLEIIGLLVLVDGLDVMIFVVLCSESGVLFVWVDLLFVVI